jgi:hypothetical protein
LRGVPGPVLAMGAASKPAWSILMLCC